eukprot:gnl/Chilomastix_cuspidata/2951.p1 GENE.gnl/Chilomastix_cuspidata/2951~~gnl/Chilomastix_cuspidata/2951.p1  ORF type:complete len:1625 (-),score=125.89 gnl/Chilomastix_cuspidata/2951:718-5592(-)
MDSSEALFLAARLLVARGVPPATVAALRRFLDTSAGTNFAYERATHGSLWDYYEHTFGIDIDSFEQILASAAQQSSNWGAREIPSSLLSLCSGPRVVPKSFEISQLLRPFRFSAPFAADALSKRLLAAPALRNSPRALSADPFNSLGIIYGSRLHRKAAFCVASTRDGRFVLTGGDDGSVKLVSSLNGKLLALPLLVRRPGAYILEIQCSANGDIIAAAVEPQELLLFTLRPQISRSTPKPFDSAFGQIFAHITNAHDGHVSLIRFAGDAHKPILLSIGDDGNLVLLATGHLFEFWEKSGGARASDDRIPSHLVVKFPHVRPRIARQRRLRTRQNVKVIWVEVALDGDIAITSSLDGHVRIFNVSAYKEWSLREVFCRNNNGELVARSDSFPPEPPPPRFIRFGAAVTETSVSPDHKWLAVSGKAPYVLLFALTALNAPPIQLSFPQAATEILADHQVQIEANNLVWSPTSDYILITLHSWARIDASQRALKGCSLIFCIPSTTDTQSAHAQADYHLATVITPNTIKADSALAFNFPSLDFLHRPRPFSFALAIEGVGFVLLAPDGRFQRAIPFAQASGDAIRIVEMINIRTPRGDEMIAATSSLGHLLFVGAFREAARYLQSPQEQFFPIEVTPSFPDGNNGSQFRVLFPSDELATLPPELRPRGAERIVSLDGIVFPSIEPDLKYVADYRPRLAHVPNSEFARPTRTDIARELLAPLQRKLLPTDWKNQAFCYGEPLRSSECLVLWYPEADVVFDGVFHRTRGPVQSNERRDSSHAASAEQVTGNVANGDITLANIFHVTTEDNIRSTRLSRHARRPSMHNELSDIVEQLVPTQTRQRVESPLSSTRAVRRSSEAARAILIENELSDTFSESSAVEAPNEEVSSQLLPEVSEEEKAKMPLYSSEQIRTRTALQADLLKVLSEPLLTSSFSYIPQAGDVLILLGSEYNRFLDFVRNDLGFYADNANVDPRIRHIRISANQFAIALVQGVIFRYVDQRVRTEAEDFEIFRHVFADLYLSPILPGNTSTDSDLNVQRAFSVFRSFSLFSKKLESPISVTVRHTTHSSPAEPLCGGFIPITGFLDAVDEFAGLNLPLDSPTRSEFPLFQRFFRMPLTVVNSCSAEMFGRAAAFRKYLLYRRTIANPPLQPLKSSLDPSKEYSAELLSPPSPKRAPVPLQHQSPIAAATSNPAPERPETTADVEAPASDDPDVAVVKSSSEESPSFQDSASEESSDTFYIPRSPPKMQQRGSSLLEPGSNLSLMSRRIRVRARYEAPHMPQSERKARRRRRSTRAQAAAAEVPHESQAPAPEEPDQIKYPLWCIPLLFEVSEPRPMFHYEAKKCITFDTALRQIYSEKKAKNLMQKLPEDTLPQSIYQISAADARLLSQAVSSVFFHRPESPEQRAPASREKLVVNVSAEASIPFWELTLSRPALFAPVSASDVPAPQATLRKISTVGAENRLSLLLQINPPLSIATPGRRQLSVFERAEAFEKIISFVRSEPELSKLYLESPTRGRSAVPGYGDHCPAPISVSLILMRLAFGFYRSQHALVDDFRRFITNSILCRFPDETFITKATEFASRLTRAVTGESDAYFGAIPHVVREYFEDPFWGEPQSGGHPEIAAGSQ